ncbi:MAG: hypothetical protein AMS18_08080 [Gemmatimonas sp. SG8_17]|nr:MAG: hypothetical protein AMS18_08080 [Gemmatimonas sp. SG8_17]
MSELTQVVSRLRQALDDMEAELKQEDPPVAALEDFKVVLDSVRANVLSFVDAADPAAYHRLVRRFRLRRASQICQTVLSGIVAGAITSDTPGYAKFRSTVEETVAQLGALLTGPG